MRFVPLFESNDPAYAGRMPHPQHEVGAIVLSGGRGRRLGHVAKGSVAISGQTLLARALKAVDGVPAVVVGDDHVPDGIARTREDPPFSGPAAAIAAGLSYVTATHVLVVAVDLAFVDAAVPRLMAASDDTDGVVAVDTDGRRQYLLSRIRRQRLQRALERQESWAGRSVRELYASLSLTPVELPAKAVLDLDTWDDVEKARNWHDEEAR